MSRGARRKAEERQMYTFDGRIRYSEVDSCGLLRPEALINYFQDCSTFQSEDGGVGIGFMKDRHMAWIVNYWQIAVYRYPALGERIRTATQPCGWKGAFIGLRNFWMETAEGERLAEAYSVWSLMDLARMMPVRAPEEMKTVYTIGPVLDLPALSRKVSVPEEGAAEKAVLTVGEEHLDSNHHVNNGQYVRFLMSMVPEEEIVTGLRIEYRRQALLGDHVHVCGYPAEAAGTAGTDEARMDPAALLGDDGQPYVTAELTIRRRKEAERDAWRRQSEIVPQ